MQIGNVNIQNKFVLAPMAGVNCTAFRMLCRENGAGLVYTQMYDCEVLNSMTEKEVKEFININEKERPVAVQLAGNDADKIIKSIKIVEKIADIIDFNIGCVENDYLAKGCGAALLKDLEKLKEILTALRNSTKKTLTAKIRIGYDAQSINAVKVCQLIEACGFNAVCIHGRTAQQKYSGKVNWTIMKQAKEKVSIQVIANGDVTSYAEGNELIKKTGCDFAMIGREAKHCPWVFSGKKLGNSGIKKQILRFIELYEKNENRQSVNELREHVYWMMRDYKTRIDPKKILKINEITKIKEFTASLQE